MRTLLFTAATTLLLGSSAALAASAVQKECSTKYQAAKSAGTLNGLTYNQYYSQCAKEARETAAPAPAAPPAAAPAPTATAAPAQATSPTQATAAAPTATAGGAVFPTAIAPEFANFKPAQARMKTCGAQWKKDKAENATGGMKWNPKGGGYMSECLKRLKS